MQWCVCTNDSNFNECETKWFSSIVLCGLEIFSCKISIIAHIEFFFFFQLQQKPWITFLRQKLENYNKKWKSTENLIPDSSIPSPKSLLKLPFALVSVTVCSPKSYFCYHSLFISNSCHWVRRKIIVLFSKNPSATFIYKVLTLFEF